MSVALLTDKHHIVYIHRLWDFATWVARSSGDVARTAVWLSSFKVVCSTFTNKIFIWLILLMLGTIVIQFSLLAACFCLCFATDSARCFLYYVPAIPRTEDTYAGEWARHVWVSRLLKLCEYAVVEKVYSTYKKDSKHPVYVSFSLNARDVQNRPISFVRKKSDTTPKVRDWTCDTVLQSHGHYSGRQNSDTSASSWLRVVTLFLLKQVTLAVLATCLFTELINYVLWVATLFFRTNILWF